MIIKNHKNKTGIVNLLSCLKFLSIFMSYVYLYYNVIFLYSVSLNSAPHPPVFTRCVTTGRLVM